MKLLLLDVDGVMTDGTKMYGPDGKVFGKRFHDHDFTAIKKFQADGWTVVLVSADMNVNQAMSIDRDIPFCYSRMEDGTIDKVKCYESLRDYYKAAPEDIVYVGDDLLDLPVMVEVVKNGGRVYCPANAVPQFSQLARCGDLPIYKLSKPGGEGVVMALYHLYNPYNNTPPTH